jgi:hypothetical protein
MKRAAKVIIASNGHAATPGGWSGIEAGVKRRKESDASEPRFEASNEMNRTGD